MNLLGDEILDFLQGINSSNSGEGLVRGFPAHVSRRIGYDHKTDLLCISSYCDTGGGYDGFTEDDRYYFRPEALLPFIAELKNQGSTEFKLKGIYSLNHGQWDHSYASPDDSSSAFIGLSEITVNIRIDNLEFKEFSIRQSIEKNYDGTSSDVNSCISSEAVENLVLKHLKEMKAAIPKPVPAGEPANVRAKLY